MSFRSILQDVRDGIGSISRRNFDVKFSYSLRSRSHSAVHDSHYRNEVLMPQSCWANMPPELLRDVISRIEASEGAWPARKHVVACSGVCRSWRAITKEIVKTPQLSGKLTFPISLSSQYQIIEVAENICNLKEEEGRRIYKRRDYLEVSKMQKDSVLYKQLS